MTPDLKLLLPKVEHSPNGRRKYFRFKPAQMIAVIGDLKEPADLGNPELVVDFSLGGIAVLTSKEFEIGDVVTVSFFYESFEAKIIPASVVTKVQRGDISKLGLKLDGTSPAYRMQKQAIEDMEFRAIENAQF